MHVYVPLYCIVCAVCLFVVLGRCECYYAFLLVYVFYLTSPLYIYIYVLIDILCALYVFCLLRFTCYMGYSLCVSINFSPLPYGFQAAGDY